MNPLQNVLSDSTPDTESQTERRRRVWLMAATTIDGQAFSIRL